MARIELETAPINTITAGSVINGTVNANGDFRLDGRLEGDITLSGKLVVGENGVVNGNVICQNANIIGAVNGNITAKEMLTLHATAKVRGDIVINRIAIEPGAVFSGCCRVFDEVKKAEAGEKREENKK